MAVTSQLVSKDRDPGRGIGIGAIPTLGVTTALALSVMSHNYRRAVENRIQRRQRRRKMGKAQIHSRNPVLVSDISKLVPVAHGHIVDALSRASEVKGSLVNFDKLGDISAIADEEFNIAKHMIDDMAHKFDEQISREFSFPGFGNWDTISRESLAKIKGMHGLINAKNVSDLFPIQGMQIAMDGGALVEGPTNKIDDHFFKHPAAAHLKQLVDDAKFNRLKEEMLTLQEQARNGLARMSAMAYEKAQLLRERSDATSPRMKEELGSAINDVEQRMYQHAKEMSHIQTRVNTFQRVASFRVVEDIARNEKLVDAKGVPQVDKVTIEMLEKRGLLGLKGRRGLILDIATHPKDSILLGERVTSHLQEAKDLHDFVVRPNEERIDFSNPLTLKFNRVRSLSKIATMTHRYMRAFHEEAAIFPEDVVSDDYLLLKELMPDMQHVGKIASDLEKMARTETHDPNLEKQARGLFHEITRTGEETHLGSFEDSINAILDKIGAAKSTGDIVNFDTKIDAENHRLVFQVLAKNGREAEFGIPFVFHNAYATGIRGKNLATKRAVFNPYTEGPLRLGDTYRNVSTEAAKSINHGIDDLIKGEKSRAKIESSHQYNLRRYEITLSDPSILANLHNTEYAYAALTKKGMNAPAQVNVTMRRLGKPVRRMKREIYRFIRELQDRVDPDGKLSGKELSDVQARIIQAGESLKHMGFATFESMNLDLTQVDLKGQETWKESVSKAQTLNELVNRLERLKAQLPKVGEQGLQLAGDRNLRMMDKIVVENGEHELIPISLSYRLSDSLASEGMIRETGGAISAPGKAINKTLNNIRAAKPKAIRKRGSLVFTTSRDSRFGYNTNAAKSAAWIMFKGSNNLMEEEGELYAREDLVDEMQGLKTHTGTVKYATHTSGRIVFKGAKNVELLPMQDNKGRAMLGSYEVRVKKGTFGSIELDGKTVKVQSGDLFQTFYHPDHSGKIVGKVSVLRQDSERLKLNLMNSGGGTTIKTSAAALLKETMGYSLEPDGNISAKHFDRALHERMSQRISGHLAYKHLNTNAFDSVYDNVTQTIFAMHVEDTLEKAKTGDPLFAALMSDKTTPRTGDAVASIQRVQAEITDGVLVSAKKLQKLMESVAGGRRGGIPKNFNLADQISVRFSGNHHADAMNEVIRPIINIKDHKLVHSVMRKLLGEDFGQLDTNGVQHFLSGTGSFVGNMQRSLAEDSRFRDFDVAYRDLIAGIGETRWAAMQYNVNYTRDEVLALYGKHGPNRIAMNVTLGTVYEHKNPMERLGVKIGRGYPMMKGGFPINMDTVMMMQQGGMPNTARGVLEEMRGRRRALSKRFYFVSRYAGLKTDDQIMDELKLKTGNRRLNPLRVRTDHTIAAQANEKSFRDLAQDIAGDDKIDAVAKQSGTDKMKYFDYEDKEIKALKVSVASGAVSDAEAEAYFSKASFKQRLEAGILTEDEFARFQKLLAEHRVLQLADSDLHIYSSSENMAKFFKSANVKGIKRGLPSEKMEFLYLPEVTAMKQGHTHRRFDSGAQRFVKVDHEYMRMLRILAKSIGATNEKAKAEVRNEIAEMYDDAAANEVRAMHNRVTKYKFPHSTMGLARSQLGFSDLLTNFNQGVNVTRKAALSLSKLIVDPHGDDAALSAVLGLSTYEQVTGTGKYKTKVKGPSSKKLVENLGVQDFQLEHNTKMITSSKFKAMNQSYLADSIHVMGERLARSSDFGIGTKAFNEAFEENFGVVEGVMKSVSEKDHAFYRESIMDAIEKHAKLVRFAGGGLDQAEMVKLTREIQTHTRKLSEHITNIYATHDRRALALAARYPVIRREGVRPMSLQIFDDRNLTDEQRVEAFTQESIDKFTAVAAGADQDGDFLYSLGLFRKSRFDEGLEHMMRENLLVRRVNQFELADGSKIPIRTIDKFLSGSVATKSLEHSTDAMLSDFANEARLAAVVEEKGSAGFKGGLEVLIKRLQLRPKSNSEHDMKGALKDYFHSRREEYKLPSIQTGHGDKAQYIIRSELAGRSLGELKEKVVHAEMSRRGVSEDTARKITDKVFDETEKKVADCYPGETVEYATLGHASSNDGGIRERREGMLRRVGVTTAKERARLLTTPELLSEVVHPERISLRLLMNPEKDELAFIEAEKKNRTIEDTNTENDRMLREVFEPGNGHYITKKGKIKYDFHMGVKQLAKDKGISYDDAFKIKIAPYKSATNNPLMKDARTILSMEKYLEKGKIAGNVMEAHLGTKLLTGVMDNWQKTFQASFENVARVVQKDGLDYTGRYVGGVIDYMADMQQYALVTKHGTSPAASGLIDTFKNLSLVPRRNEDHATLSHRVAKSWESIWEGKDINVHLNSFEKQFGTKYFAAAKDGRITLEGKIEAYHSMNKDIDSAIDEIRSSTTDAPKSRLDLINSMIHKYEKTKGKEGNAAIYHILHGSIVQDEGGADIALKRLMAERTNNAIKAKGYAKMKSQMALKRYIPAAREAEFRSMVVINQTQMEVTRENFRAAHKARTAGSAVNDPMNNIHQILANDRNLETSLLSSGANDNLAFVMDLQKRSVGEDAVAKATANLRRAKEAVEHAPKLIEGGVRVNMSEAGEHFMATSGMDHIYSAIGRRIKKGAGYAREHASGRSAFMLFTAGLVGASALMPSVLAGDQNGLGGGYFGTMESKNEKQAQLRQQTWLARRMTSGSKYIRIEDNRFRNLRHVTRQDAFNDMLNASQKASLNVYGPNPGMFTHG